MQQNCQNSKTKTGKQTQNFMSIAVLILLCECKVLTRKHDINRIQSADIKVLRKVRGWTNIFKELKYKQWIKTALTCRQRKEKQNSLVQTIQTEEVRNESRNRHWTKNHEGEKISAGQKRGGGLWIEEEEEEEEVAVVDFDIFNTVYYSYICFIHKF